MEKDDLLRRTNAGLDVFRHYIPGNWRVGRNFLNPFYGDTKASFNVYYDKRSCCYRMKDFGNEHYSGDCFKLVGLIHGWDCTRTDDFVRILNRIAYDMNLACAGHEYALPKPQSTPAPTTGITALGERAFTPAELCFWQSYGIGRELLERYGVSSLTGLAGRGGTTLATDAEPVFLYRFSGGQGTCKVYRPFSQNRFLYLRKQADECFGYDRLPPSAPLVVITGGEKDVLTLSALGIPAFCLNSETADVPEALMQLLCTRFSDVVILYDADETGMRCSQAVCGKFSGRYPVQRLQLPLAGSKEEKDISDFVRLRLREGLAPERLAVEITELLQQAVAARYDALLQSYAACFINAARPPQKPETVIRVHHQAAASPGDLVCITGGAGTGKSNYADCILSGALNTMMREIDTLGMQVIPNVDQKALLLFDTEQSEYQSYQNMERILRRARLASTPACMQVVNLCRIARKERQRLIENCMEAASRKFHGIHSVIIDGLADLIHSANDEEESVRLIEWLHGLAQRFATVIVSVVHTAGLPEKVRGHVGSELTRKSSAVIDIECDKKRNCSVVKILKLRGGSVARAGLSAFDWDERVEMHRSLGML